MPVFDRDARRQLVQRRRLLEALVVLLIVFGAGAFYFLVADRSAFLFYFFVPVSIGAVLSGRVKGLLFAGLAALGVIGPIAINGTGFLNTPLLSQNEVALRLVAWALSLGVAAYLIGLVSEIGGNRVLVLGLASDAMSAVERERKRMAYDVHDGVAQTVSTALMQADILEMMVEDNEGELKKQASDLRQTLAGGVEEIRTMIGNLRPPALTAREFPNTVARLVEDFRGKTGVKLELALDADLRRASDSVRICLYRVIQEALSNIERHAGASRAWIGISENRGGVFLSIRDDGAGFDPKTADQSGHYGLASMQERVWLLTGHIQIDSKPAEGTTIRAYIPHYQS
ncbi:MAG: hypothetical protein Kow00129_12740 [Thermoleophilia bacterium]